MKQETKSALSRRRILDAALWELSRKGYDGASLNAVCAEHGISKGAIYHHFRDKDELYLLCVSECFDSLTAYLRDADGAKGTAERRLQAYFDARMRFFAERPIYRGAFLSATLTPPPHLRGAVAKVREPFDSLNVQTLTSLLQSAPLRPDVAIAEVLEDFGMYMDYFNARLQTVVLQSDAPERALEEHERRCRRQLHLLLYGVLEERA